MKTNGGTLNLQPQTSWISLGALGKRECRACQGLGKVDESLPLPNLR